MTWYVKSIPLEGLSETWEIAGPLLAPAVARSGGRTDMRHTFKGLRDGRLILWVAFEDDKMVRAAFTTRVAEYPLKKMLVVECAGGERMTEWLPEADRTFRHFAADSGLDGVEMYGRSGWTRALGAHGWKQSMVVCETATGDDNVQGA